MDIWEYREVTIELSKKKFFQFDKWNTTEEIEKKLCYYGSYGWELVNIIPIFWGGTEYSYAVREATFYFKRKKVDVQDKEIIEIRKSFYPEYDFNFDKGIELYNDDDYKEAEKYLKNAYENDKSSVEIQLWLGATLYQLKKYEDAEIIIKKALKTDINSSTAWEWLVEILEALGKVEEANNARSNLKLIKEGKKLRPVD